MSKTLVVQYAPRINSYTKLLVDEFLDQSRGKTKITLLDLDKTPPDLLLAKNLNLMIDWNNGKRIFTDSEQAVLSNHMNLIQQFLNADHIILAFPIYNFTMPATVKAWIDAIVVSDKTFSFNPHKGFEGLCKGKKAASIIVSGFDYNKPSQIKEYASLTIKQNFDFMGLESKVISAYGVDEKKHELDQILSNSKQEISSLIMNWYSNN